MLVPRGWSLTTPAKASEALSLQIAGLRDIRVLVCLTRMIRPNVDLRICFWTTTVKCHHDALQTAHVVCALRY